MSSGVELYREVQGNESFRKWILDMVFNATYAPSAAARTSRQKGIVYTVEPRPVQMVAEPETPYGSGGLGSV